MNIHLIAIGGSAMHNLALALHDSGHTVTGSDDEIFEPSKSRLAAAGLLPKTIGWNVENIHAELDVVIVGMHARQDNPELLRAQDLDLEVLSYPEFLYRASADKTRVVIAGSHGKTSISAMVLHVCQYAGVDTDFMVGAQLEGFKNMVQLSDDKPFMLIEGDEYPASPTDLRPKFLSYKPNIALISGIAWDHMNVFPTYEVYLKQFEQFLDITQAGSAMIYFEEDPEVKKLVENYPKAFKRIPYKTHEYQVMDGVYYLITPEGELPLQIFGAHNMANVEGARWICRQMGIMDEEFYAGIMSFKGANKRLQVLSQKNEKTVYLDFAHAPSKVKATLGAVLEKHQGQKVRACLELHTFSSLNQNFMPQYQNCLAGADEIMVYYNPKAVAHKKLPELSKAIVAQAFNLNENQIYNDISELEQALFSDQNTAVTLLMSSGNFDNAPIKDWADKLTQ